MSKIQKTTTRSFDICLRAGAALRKLSALLSAMVLFLLPMLLLDRAFAEETPRTCQTYSLSIQKLEVVLEDGAQMSLNPDAETSVTLTPQSNSTLTFSFSNSSEEQNAHLKQAYTITFVPLSDHEWRCDSKVVYTGVLGDFQIPNGTEYQRSESLALDSTKIGSTVRLRVADGGGASYSDDSTDVWLSPGVYSATFRVTDGGIVVRGDSASQDSASQDSTWQTSSSQTSSESESDGCNCDDSFDLGDKGTLLAVIAAAAAGGLAVLGGTIAVIAKVLRASKATAQPVKPALQSQASTPTSLPDIPLGAAEYLGGPGDNPYTSFEDVTTCKLS